MPHSTIKVPEVETYVVELEPGQDKLDDVDVAEAEAEVLVLLIVVVETLVGIGATDDDEAGLVDEVETNRAFHTPLLTIVPQEDFI